MWYPVWSIKVFRWTRKIIKASLRSCTFYHIGRQNFTPQAEIDDEHRKSELLQKFLLEKGAHADVKSEYPNDDVPVLEDYEIPPMKYLTLKCLAANASLPK